MTQVLIKRSLDTSIPASLANGELAWTSNGDILYIGANDVIVPIGSKRTPGTLTANQAIVANSTGMIDVIRMGNSTVNVVANSLALTLSNSTVTFSLVKPTAAEASGSNYLKADGTWASVETSAVAGSNTQVQFNDSSALGGSAGFTFDKDANNLFVGNTVSSPRVDTGLIVFGSNLSINTSILFTGNSTVNATVNSTMFAVRNATISSTLQPASLSMGSNVTLTTSTLSLGNSTVNSIANSLGVFTQNSTISSVFGIGGANVGANVIIGTVSVAIGNSTVNSVSNSTILRLQTASGSANLSATSLALGSAVINTTAVALGANVFLDTVTLSLGNSTVNTTINSSAGVWTGDLSCRDMTVAGNLVINGTLTTIDTTNLIVEDPLIKLSKNNNAGDTLDIGFYGLYDASGSQDVYTGLFRDATDAKYKLFELLQTEPTTTVDTGGTGYVPAWLVCNLESANVNITGGVIDAGTF